MIRLITRITLFAAIVVTLQALLSLKVLPDKGGVPIPLTGKYLRLPRGSGYEASSEILSIQEHQQTHAELGFLWKPDIDTADEVIIAWGDIPAGAISTDRWGYANGPAPIADLAAGRKVDIIGIGASYMGGAQNLFYEYFGFKDVFFYNIAHGRFTLPQFNIALREHGLPLKPSLVVYGLNEVSWNLIEDFEQWQKSNLDWFEFHSGTWCGPAVTDDAFSRIMRAHPRLHGLWSAVSRKVWWGALPTAGDRARVVDKAFRYVREAHAMTVQSGSRFVVLLIPSRETAVAGPSARSALFDAVIPRMKKEGIAFIDLRPDYAQAENPRDLYFVYDGHWNRQGIYRAARALWTYLVESTGDVPGTVAVGGGGRR